MGYSHILFIVDEIHSQRQQVYFWSGNCLRKISDLEDQELQEVKLLLAEEMENRATQAEAIHG